MIDRRVPTGAQGIRRFAGLLLLTMLVVAGLSRTGVPRAIDTALQSMYYRVGFASHSEQRVLLVEADDRTIEAWGPPSWEADRWSAALQQIASGHPSAIVVLDGPRMIRGELPAGHAPLREVPLVELSTTIDPGSTSVDSLSRDDVPLAQLRPVLEALGRPELDPERLWIDYLWPPSRLPSVPLHRVGDAEALSTTLYEHKIVVVGLTSPSHRDALPTPVGILTSPEIIGHALAMLADERGWYEPSAPLRILGLVLVVGVAAFALRRTTPAQGVIRAASIGAGLVLLDLLTFSLDLVRWGVASELLAVFVAMIGHWYLTQKSSAEIVETVTDHLSDRRPPEAATPPDEYWQDVVDGVRKYVDIECTGMIAELPENAWHLEPRAFIGINEGDVVERRRDVRRPPYRGAFLTHTPTHCERPFVADPERWTLVVPLVHRRRIYGMWMVSFDQSTTLDSAEMMVFEVLAAELGRSIAAFRRGLQRKRNATVSSDRDVTRGLSNLRESLEVLSEDKQDVVATFDSLPTGLLTADVLGRIVQVNDTLRDHLDAEFPAGIPHNNLTAVLARLTDASLDSVHEIMRSVVRTGKTFRVRPAPQREDCWAAYLLIPVHNSGAADPSVSKGVTTRLVLMAVPRDLEPVVDMLMRSA